MLLAPCTRIVTQLTWLPDNFLQDIVNGNNESSWLCHLILCPGTSGSLILNFSTWHSICPHVALFLHKVDRYEIMNTNNVILLYFHYTSQTQKLLKILKYHNLPLLINTEKLRFHIHVLLLDTSSSSLCHVVVVTMFVNSPLSCVKPPIQIFFYAMKPTI